MSDVIFYDANSREGLVSGYCNINIVMNTIIWCDIFWVSIFSSSESIILMSKLLNIFAIFESSKISYLFSNTVIHGSVVLFQRKEVLQFSKIFDYQIGYLDQNSYSIEVLPYVVISHTPLSLEGF